jgi:exonuclease VII large subunit
VARAIYACELPVVTGIGREIDFTIADLVADRRAATPSAAAEVVSPDQQELLNQQRNLEARLVRAFMSRVNRGQEALQWLSKRLVHPRRRLMDQVTKRRIYERHGCARPIHPADRVLTVYRLSSTEYGKPDVQELVRDLYGGVARSRHTLGCARQPPARAGPITPTLIP